MPDDLNKKFESRHIRNLAKASARIRQIYDQSILEITLKAKKITLNGEVFDLKKHPALKRAIEDQIKKLHASIYTTIVNSVTDSWNLSNEKNNILVDKRLAGKTASQRAKQILYDPNIEALKEFLKRTEKGLNLSKRIWNAVNGFKLELEAGLGIGISEGRSAVEMARDLKKYLVDPNKLFRRVRDAEGKLKLSKPAREFKPGQGRYRSSFKNALRLTRTETNIAYRSSGWQRWQTLPFVIGIEIKLSASHVFRQSKGKKVCEICECLKGTYPKDFLFTGWHPSCLCFQVAVLMNDKDYSSIEDEILGIGKANIKPKGVISKPPASFTKFLKDNGAKIKGLKSKPYWVKDNPDFVSL